MKPQSVLEIYVAPGCIASETARDLAGTIRTADRPGLEVRLVDLGEPDTVLPSAVFAVPTYLLDGRVISLGNPDESWLLARLGVAGSPGGTD